MIARRHMHQFGTTRGEQMAAVAVKNLRQWREESAGAHAARRSRWNKRWRASRFPIRMDGLRLLADQRLVRYGGDDCAARTGARIHQQAGEDSGNRADLRSFGAGCERTTSPPSAPCAWPARKPTGWTGVTGALILSSPSAHRLLYHRRDYRHRGSGVRLQGPRRALCRHRGAHLPEGRASGEREWRFESRRGIPCGATGVEARSAMSSPADPRRSGRVGGLTAFPGAGGEFGRLGRHRGGHDFGGA